VWRLVPPGSIDTAQYDEQDHEEDAHEQVACELPSRILTSVGLAAVEPASRSVSSLSFVCQKESILDTAASSQDIWIFAALIAFAYNVCATQLEFFGQGRLAVPLDVILIVVGPLIGATHDIDCV